MRDVHHLLPQSPITADGSTSEAWDWQWVNDAWYWIWTSLYGRIVGLAIFAAAVPTFLRLHCRPSHNPGNSKDINPWNPRGWTRQEWFWAVDFSIGAWVAYFGSIAETYKDMEEIPNTVLVVGVVLTILTAAIVSFTERNGWDIVSGHGAVMRRIKGVVVPNMLGFLCIVVAIVHVTTLRQ